jgi:predicted ATPase/class 3 adenylate cyclase
MSELPRGTVTFLFTDIEGSTRLWEQDRAGMATAVDRHFALLDAAIAAHGGVRFKTVGDGAQAAFPTAPAAVAAALDAQRALDAERWGEIGAPRVRMALHAGEAIPDDRGDYLAAPLNRLARLLATGHGGQILLTQAVQQLARGDLPNAVGLRDLGEHRLRDLLEPERVYQVLHPDLPADFPPLTSLDTRPHNLPRQPTPFLGREREIGEVAHLLRRDDVQLLTLTGPGGTGKTRLALQAAAELLDEFPDGVFFVPLAPLSDPERIPSAIGSVLGVREEGERSLVERLRDALATRQMLLVLDNFEHLAAGAPLIGELLAASPRLKVLATSRLPLHLRAEREYPVPPLALPRRKPPPTLEQLSQYEAVRLFIERAQAVKPDFAIDNENAPAVAEICHRLDGLPLAIELAAARVRMLPPRAMLLRLEKRLPLLIGGARDAPARQRTLRETIRWSHELLADEEQILFRRLAVFAGGATFEAAETVANADGDLDVFAGLERLVEQNLLRQIVGQDGEPRFVMLETVREFGLEQLAAAGESEATYARLTARMRTLFAEGDQQLSGPQTAEWLSRLDADHDNLRTALVWSMTAADAETSLCLAADAGVFWYLSGHWSEGREWLGRAVARAPEAPLQARARAQIQLGRLAHYQGDDALAIAALEPALALCRRLGDQTGAAYALYLLGIGAEDVGNFDQAAVWMQESLQLSRDADDTSMVAWAHYHLGIIASGQGDMSSSFRACQEALALFRQIGELWGIAVTLGYIGLLASITGEQERAAEVFRESLPIFDTLGIIEGLVETLANVAVLAHTLGQHEAAARLIGAAAGMTATLGARAVLPERDFRAPATAAVRAELGEAAFERACEAGRSLTREEAIAEALAVADTAIAEPTR